MQDYGCVKGLASRQVDPKRIHCQRYSRIRALLYRLLAVDGDAELALVLRDNSELFRQDGAHGGQLLLGGEQAQCATGNGSK